MAVERPVESWLASKDHDKWATAIMHCQGGAPWECGGAGACRRGGDCFTTDRQGACVAWRMIQGLKSENAVVQRHLDRAVQYLRFGQDT